MGACLVSSFFPPTQNSNLVFGVGSAPKVFKDFFREIVSIARSSLSIALPFAWVQNPTQLHIFWAFWT